MSERKPMLSHEQMLEMAKESHFEPRYYEVGELPFAISIRDHYERLITTGKLRVVEEVDLWHPSVPEEQWRQWLTGNDPEFTMLVTKCCGRNPWTPPWLLSKAFIDSDGVFNRTPSGYVCPGCGNTITRSLTLDESSTKLSDMQDRNAQMGGGV